MSFLDIFLLSFTICIDSFFICLFTNYKKKSHAFLIPILFTFFQCLFVFLGFSLGNVIEIYLKNYINYISFLTFSFMAIKLILDVFINKDEKNKHFNFPVTTLLNACLTSFDSLFLGIPLSIKTNNFLLLILVISTLTYFVCLFALLIRKSYKTKLNEKANLVGAIILFFFAFKSLL